MCVPRPVSIYVSYLSKKRIRGNAVYEIFAGIVVRTNFPGVGRIEDMDFLSCTANFSCEAVLLSPDLRHKNNQCVKIEYELMFDHINARFEVVSENTEKILWKARVMPGKYYYNAYTAAIDIPPEVRRIKFVVRVLNRGNFVLKSVDVKNSVCSKFYNMTSSG